MDVNPFFFPFQYDVIATVRPELSTHLGRQSTDEHRIPIQPNPTGGDVPPSSNPRRSTGKLRTRCLYRPSGSWKYLGFPVYMTKSRCGNDASVKFVSSRRPHAPRGCPPHLSSPRFIVSR